MTTNIHPIDPAVDTTPPAWLNLEAVFPSELNLPERIVELVNDGAKLLDDLHEFMTYALPVIRQVNERAWLDGVDDRLEVPDGFPELVKRCIGADALDSLMWAMVGLVAQAKEGDVPHDAWYAESIERFGLDPLWYSRDAAHKIA